MIPRAPTEHGQILAVPALDQVGPLLHGNHHLLSDPSCVILGTSLGELRAAARREILAASAQYHQEAGEAVPNTPSDLWILAGHQPELFHPGVWFKNFAIHGLARQHAAVSLNLIVDTDCAKPPLLHVPADDRLARVAYDRSVMDTPYEERLVEDGAAFADFPNRVAPIAARWNFEPMLPAFWDDVMRHATRTPLMGERFAAARRAIERQWDCAQREVPMSRVCQTAAFARFACSIVGRLPEFHATYNQVVRHYRQAHRIRSRNHPVPDLTVNGEWLETPFWAWRAGQLRRGKLFVRQTRDAWTLKIGNAEGPTLPGDPARMVDVWRELETQGIKIRTRALTTTMFARLFLADVFIHGIGGGLYDELTDRIIERHFGLPAPAYLVLSATLLLPLERHPDAATRFAQLARRRRDLTYQPERFIERNALTNQKDEWITRQTMTHADRVKRFERIRAVNAQLHPFVVSELERVNAKLEECKRRIARNEFAGRRDYAFCLYPEEMLRGFFASFIG